MKSLPQNDPNFLRDMRQATYGIMAGLLWSQYCLENSIEPANLAQAPKEIQEEVVALCEAAANLLLEPDRKDAALMAMADVIVRDNSVGSVTITEAPKQAQLSYLKTAEGVLRALLLNMQDEAPDARYRESMCRLVDAVAPKKGVH